MDEQPSRFPKFTAVGLCTSMVLLAACLAFPAYSEEGPEGPATAHSLLVLAIGWLGIGYQVHEWLANPLLLLAWILMFARNYKGAAITALAATLVAASFLLRENIVISEAPTYGRVLGYHAGYWLWLASPAVASLASAWAMRRSPPASK